LLESHLCFPPSAVIEAQLVSAVPTDEDILREKENAQPQGLPQQKSQKRQATLPRNPSPDPIEAENLSGPVTRFTCLSEVALSTAWKGCSQKDTPASPCAVMPMAGLAVSNGAKHQTTRNPHHRFPEEVLEDENIEEKNIAEDLSP
jgi:hypothetical protein